MCVFLHILKRLENYFTAFLYDHDDDTTKVQVAFVTLLCFRSPDQGNPSYTRFNQDVEDFVHNIVRDQTGNVVGTVVQEVAGSGDDEKTDEDAGVFEDIPLAVPAMDIVEPVVGVPSPLPSVVNELYKAFKMLENNR